MAMAFDVHSPVSTGQRTRSLPSICLLFIILNCPSVNAIFDFEAYMKAPNAEFSDHFGYAVSLSGDTLAVGSRKEDSCATTVSTTAATDVGCIDAGAVYVFTRSGTTWTFEAYVKAPNAEDNDNFGEALALSGDTLVVAASWESSCNTTVSTTAATNNDCSNAGAVYVFTRSGTTWTFEAYVKAPNAGADDNFGWSVSLSGDTLAVGSYYEDSCETTVSTSAATDNNCTDAGAVYVFTRSGTTWTFESYVKAPNGEAFDTFGWSVSLSGDTLIATSPQEGSCNTTVSTTAATDNDCSNAGAAYVFTRSSTRSGATWALEAYVKAPNAEESDRHGESASVSGDKLVVGTLAEASCATGVNTTASTDNNCYYVGAAYVFIRSGSTWTFAAYVKAPNAGDDDFFGQLQHLRLHQRRHGQRLL